MPDMSIRRSDKKLSILREKIRGCRLPSYKQVLFCFLSNFEKLKSEDHIHNQSLKRSCANFVVDKVLHHYRKARIPTQYEHKMTEKIIDFHSTYCSLFKIKPEKRPESQKIKEFHSKLETTMPFWPRDVEKKMAESKKGKTLLKKEAIEEDLVFLKSMKTDRTAQYTTKDNAMAKLEKTRSGRQNKSSNKKQQGSEDTTVVVSQSSDSSEQESEGENTIVQRSHKRIV